MSRRGQTDITSYAGAEKFLAGGRNKARRRLAGNRCVEQLGADTIGIVLHNTVIVAFHSDGTETINTGGWNTVTTKKWINAHSHAQVWSVDCRLFVNVHAPSFTAPRVQKCRSCRGAGRLPETCYGYWYDYKTNTRKPCEHGETERHANGTRECYRCNGAGRTDYGSKPIHYEWDGGPLRVSAIGEPLPAVDALAYYCTSACLPTTSSKPKPAPAVTSYTPAASHVTADPDLVTGSTVVTTLAELVPEIRTPVACPACGDVRPLIDTVPHLNDSHRWTREEIADWLESLDANLTFTA